MEESTKLYKDTMAYIAENQFNNSSETSDQQHQRELAEHFKNEFQDEFNESGNPHFPRAGSTTTIQSHDTHNSGVEHNENEHETNEDKVQQVEEEKVEEKEEEKIDTSGPMPVKPR